MLLADRLYGLLDAFDTAQRTPRVIHQNFAWAVACNAVAVPLALGGWVTPLAAAVGMSSSSLIVVLNALRLLRARRARRCALRPRCADSGLTMEILYLLRPQKNVAADKRRYHLCIRVSCSTPGSI